MFGDFCINEGSKLRWSCRCQYLNVNISINELKWGIMTWHYSVYKSSLWLCSGAVLQRLKSFHFFSWFAMWKIKYIYVSSDRSVCKWYKTYNYFYTHVENDGPWPVACGIFYLCLSGPGSTYHATHSPDQGQTAWSRGNLWCLVEGAIQNQFFVVTWWTWAT